LTDPIAGWTIRGKGVVAVIGSLIVGWLLIVLGFLGVGAGIGVAIIEAFKKVSKEAPTLGPDPFDSLVKLAAELLKVTAGVPFVLGIVAIGAGITVIHYQWF
jgi:hypothetical protein